MAKDNLLPSRKSLGQRLRTNRAEGHRRWKYRKLNFCFFSKDLACPSLAEEFVQIKRNECLVLLRGDFLYVPTQPVLYLFGADGLLVPLAAKNHFLDMKT